jgi:hypothetical protein
VTSIHDESMTATSMRALFRSAPALLITLLLASGCARNGPPNPAYGGPAPDVATDSAQFRAILENLIVGTRIGELHVRPAPLPRHPDVFRIDIVSTAPLLAETIRARAALLRSMRIPNIRTIDLPACGGWWYPGETKPPKKCPTKPRIFVAVGLSREGGAYAPAHGLDQRAEGLARGEQAVRVAVMTEGNEAGVVLLFFDYVLRRLDDGDWVVVKRVRIPGGDN